MNVIGFLHKRTKAHKDARLVFVLTLALATFAMPQLSFADAGASAGFDPTTQTDLSGSAAVPPQQMQIPGTVPTPAPTPMPTAAPELSGSAQTSAQQSSSPAPTTYPAPQVVTPTTLAPSPVTPTQSQPQPVPTAVQVDSSQPVETASLAPGMTKKQGAGEAGASKGKVGSHAQATSKDPNVIIEEMNKAIEEDPGDAGAFDQRGAAYNQLEKFDEAMHDLDLAIKLDPTLATAYANRGYTFYKLNKFQEALKDLNEAIRLNPNLAQAYTCRGNVYSKLEQYQKSIADINKGLALQQSEKDSGSLLSRCRTEYLVGNYKQALADANSAIARDPNNPVGYDNRGLCEHQLKQFQSAIKDYNKALSLKPQEPKYICHRAISYAEMGQHEKAVPDYDEAIRLKPNFALAYYDRAISHYLMHHYEQATKDMQQAIKYDPHYALALYELPLDPTKGAKDVRKIVNPEEYYYRATTRILMIKNQTALADLKQYLEMTNWRGELSLSAVILSYLGFMVNHQTDAAQQVLTAAASRVDTSQWPYDVIRYLKGEIKADDLLAQAGGDTDRLTDANAYIGINMMLKGGDHKEAVKHMMWAKQQGNGNLVSYSLAVREIEKIQFKKHRETERT
jgi:tetratricopeptide (TPR) repeat protein